MTGAPEPTDLEGMPPAARHPAEVEAARLRYELSRLRDRRPVRAALALTSWRKAGRAAVWATLRGAPPRWDAAGPDAVPARPRYPHLRCAHLGADPVTGGIVPSLRVTPADLTGLARDRVDLLLLDDLTGWDEAHLDALLREATAVGAATVAVGADAIAAVGARVQLRVADATHAVPPDADLAWLPAVDPRRDSPVGRAPAVVPVGMELLPAVLARAARGEVPVAVDDPLRRQAFGPLADQLLVEPSVEAVAARIEQLRADPDARDALSVRVRRHVLTAHARAARVDELVRRLELDAPPRRRIGLLLATRRPDLLPGVTADLARQTWADTELVVAVHGDAPVPERLPLAPSSVVRVPTTQPLGVVLNAALDATGPAELFAKIDDDDRYGPDHLADLVLALDYSGAEAVGKRRHAVHTVTADALTLPDGDSEERWEDHLPGATTAVRGDVLRALRWRHVPNGVDTELVRAIHLAGGACYSTHRFGFVRTRHGDHTYTAGRFDGRALRDGLAAVLEV